MRIITGRGEYVTESRCSRVSFRQRGSTVQGTNKRTKTQGVAERHRRCGFSARSRELDRPIERDARRALNMQRIRNTRHIDTREKRQIGSERERDVRHFISSTRATHSSPVSETHSTERQRTLTSLLVGDLIEAVLKDLVQMHRLVVGRHVFARDVKTSGRSVVEASGHGFAVRPRAEPPSSRYYHPHY